MYTIIKSSKTGSTKQVQSIYFEPGPKTYAASVLLRHDLKMQDPDYLQSYEFRMLRVEFSRKTLRRWQKSLGTLFCVYCNKPGLQIEYEGMKISRDIMATLEHLDPTSKGGDMFDLNRIVCACGKCNGKRSNKELATYLQGRMIQREDFDSRCQSYFGLNTGLDVAENPGREFRDRNSIIIS